MLGQRFPNPTIFSLIGPNNHYKVVSYRIVRMEEVDNDSEETEAASKDYEFVVGAEFLEEVLLVFLRKCQRTLRKS